MNKLHSLPFPSPDIRMLLVLDPKNDKALKERDDIRARKLCSDSLDWPGDAELAVVASVGAALEIEDESDSEDFAHAGNGTPCKFYNRGACRHGPRCRFKHAPDRKSVRDELSVTLLFVRTRSIVTDVDNAQRAERLCVLALGTVSLRGEMRVRA